MHEAIDQIEDGQDRLLEAGEVADLIGVDVEYIWKLARERRIPRIRLGRVYRFRRQALLKWLEDLEEGGGQPV